MPKFLGNVSQKQVDAEIRPRIIVGNKFYPRDWAIFAEENVSN